MKGRDDVVAVLAGEDVDRDDVGDCMKLAIIAGTLVDDVMGDMLVAAAALAWDCMAMSSSMTEPGLGLASPPALLMMGIAAAGMPCNPAACEEKPIRAASPAPP